MKRLVLFGWLLSGVIAVGCDTGSTPSGGEVPPSGGDSTVDETTTGDSAAAAPQTEDNSALDPTAERSLAAAPEVAEADELEPGDVAATDAPTLEDFQQQLMEAAEAKDGEKALAVVEAAIAAFPDDVGMQANRLVLRIGADREMEATEPDAAAERFVQTGALARELEAHRDQLPMQIQQAIPFAYYQQARGYAHQGKVAETLNAIQTTADSGVSLSQLILTDDDFAAAVTGNAEFQAGMNALCLNEARRAIAETESFAFDFELPDLDTKTVKLADFQGQLLIVDVWGTWCPPCRQEIPHFIKLKDTYSKDLEIVGINYEDGEGEEVIEKVRKFATEQGMNYPLVIGDQATQEKIPNLSGFPTTLFLDRTGKVRLKIVGYHPYELLNAYVTVLLEESPGA